MNRKDESADMRPGKRASVRYYGVSFAVALLLVGGAAIAGLGRSESEPGQGSRISPAIQEILDRPLPPETMHYFIWLDEKDPEMAFKAAEIAEAAPGYIDLHGMNAEAGFRFTQNLIDYQTEFIPDRPVQVHKVTSDQEQLATSMMNDMAGYGTRFETIDLRR